MTDPQHDLPEDLAALSALDPTATDAPPAPGSARHRQILEQAMSTTDPAAASPTTSSGDELTAPAETAPPATAAPHHRPSRHWLALAAAAAVVVAIVGVVVLIQPDRKLTPAAALSAAADNTGDVITLRLHAEYARTAGPSRTLDARINGADYAFRSVATYSTGGATKTETEATTTIGDTVWEADGDRVTKRTNVPPEERNAPYQTSSRAVIKAALTGSTVVDLGRGEVRDGEADHYRIELNRRSLAALSALSPSQTAQFELENPGGVKSLEVWVDDGLIRRIALALYSGSTRTDEATGITTSTETEIVTIDYYDFGADITISPPS